MRVFLYTTLILLYMLSQFIPHLFLSYTIGVIAVITCFISAFHARGLHRITGFVFLVLGIFLFIYNDLEWHTFFLQFQSMLGLLSLFVVLPFINSLIRIGRYDKSLSQLLQDRVTRLTSLYKRSFLVCHFLGVFLNLAALPLLIQSVKPSLHTMSRDDINQFFTKNLLRAYALCLTWSPMEVIVSRSIDITQAQYYMILPIVLGIAVIATGVDFVLSGRRYKEFPVSMLQTQEVDLKKVIKKVVQMLGMLILFIVLVTITQQMLGQGFLFSVVLLLVPFSIFWAACLKKTKIFLSATIPHWKVRVDGLANYFFMFLSAGLFVGVLAISGMLSFLEPLFQYAAETPVFLYLFIGAYFLVTAFIGFHPLISQTFLAEFLVPILPQVATLPLAVVLVTCGLSTIMYSPFNLSVSLLSSELKINPFRMAGWNVGYGVVYILISIAVALFLEWAFY